MSSSMISGRSPLIGASCMAKIEPGKTAGASRANAPIAEVRATPSRAVAVHPTSSRPAKRTPSGTRGESSPTGGRNQRGARPDAASSSWFVRRSSLASDAGE